MILCKTRPTLRDDYLCINLTIYACRFKCFYSIHNQAALPRPHLFRRWYPALCSERKTFVSSFKSHTCSALGLWIFLTNVMLAFNNILLVKSIAFHSQSRNFSVGIFAAFADSLHNKPRIQPCQVEKNALSLSGQER